MKSERFEKGWNKFKEIDEHYGESAIEQFKDIAPDLTDMIFEFMYGDVYCREGLDLKAREIAAVAALTAMGNATPQLKIHMHAALQVGVTQKEIVEILIQMAAYAGFPAAVNGVVALKEVLEERKMETE